MNTTSERILDAVSLLVQNAVNGLAFDKTIKAEIYSVVSAITGEYKVKYEGAVFSAFASDVTAQYKIRDMVYVKVPEGDMSARKTIECLVEGNENLYADVPILQQYLETGVGLNKLVGSKPADGNLIAAWRPKSMDSEIQQFFELMNVGANNYTKNRYFYKVDKTYVKAGEFDSNKIYYACNVGPIDLTESQYVANKYFLFNEESNKYYISTTKPETWDTTVTYYTDYADGVNLYMGTEPQGLFTQYSLKYDAFKVSAQFKTDLRERHYKGNYGIVFEFFTSEKDSKDEYKTVSYTFDCKDFIGDPYNYNVYATQQIVFKQKNKGYLTGIKNIYFYQRDFDLIESPRSGEYWVNLKVRNVDLEFVSELSDEYTVNIISPNGYEFDNDVKNITLQGRLIYQRRDIYEADKCKCQWYRQDMSVNVNNTENYDRKAGYGWSAIKGATDINLTLPHSYSYSTYVTVDDTVENQTVQRYVYFYMDGKTEKKYAKIDTKYYPIEKGKIIKTITGADGTAKDNAAKDDIVKKLKAKKDEGVSKLEIPKHKEKYKLIITYQDNNVFNAETPYLINKNEKVLQWSLKQATDIDEGIYLELLYDNKSVDSVEDATFKDKNYKFAWYEDEGKGLIQRILGQSENKFFTKNYYQQGTSETFYCEIYTEANGIKSPAQILQHTISSVNPEEAVTVTFEGQDTFRYDAKGDTPYEDTELVRIIIPHIAWADGAGNSYGIEWFINNKPIVQCVSFIETVNKIENKYNIYYYKKDDNIQYFILKENHYYELIKKDDQYEYKKDGENKIFLTETNIIEQLKLLGDQGTEADNAFHPLNSMFERVWVDAHYNVHFKIRMKYRNDYNNNILTIKLTTIDNKEYLFNKEILFVKDGDPGVNGTSYVAVIRPVSIDNEGVIKQLTGIQPLYYDNKNTENVPGLILKVFVYKDGEPVETGNNMPQSKFTVEWDYSKGNVDIMMTPVYEGLSYYDYKNEPISTANPIKYTTENTPLQYKYNSTEKKYYYYYNEEFLDVKDNLNNTDGNAGILKGCTIKINNKNQVCYEYFDESQNCIWRFKAPADISKDKNKYDTLYSLETVKIIYQYSNEPAVKNEEKALDNIYARHKETFLNKFTNNAILKIAPLKNKDKICRFVKAKVTIDNNILYPAYGIDYILKDLSSIDVSKIETNIPKSIKYNSSGLHPMTYGDALFFTYDGKAVTIKTPFTSETKYVTIEKEKKENSDVVEYYLKPASNFESGQNNPMGLIKCLTPSGDFEFYRTIFMFLDTFGNEYLNGWDGTSLDVNENNAYILAPMIGAGIKNSGNTFTGVVMGKYNDGETYSKVGLFGFNNGINTFSLNDDGSAWFGASSKGRINLSTNGDAVIYGGTSEGGKGSMILDLMANSPGDKAIVIKKLDSSGEQAGDAFSITYNGDAYFDGTIETEDGHIAGWSIQEKEISNGHTSIHCNNGITIPKITIRDSEGTSYGTLQSAFGEVASSDTNTGNIPTQNISLRTEGKYHSTLIESQYNVVLRTESSDGTIVLGDGWNLGTGHGALRCTIPAYYQDGIYARFAPSSLKGNVAGTGSDGSKDEDITISNNQSYIYYFMKEDSTSTDIKKKVLLYNGDAWPTGGILTVTNKTKLEDSEAYQAIQGVLKGKYKDIPESYEQKKNELKGLIPCWQVFKHNNNNTFTLLQIKYNKTDENDNTISSSTYTYWKPYKATGGTEIEWKIIKDDSVIKIPTT